LPTTPVGYSDNVSDRSIVFDIKDIPDVKVDIQKVDVKKDDNLRLESLPTNIQSLTYEDSLQVGYLESKIYSDNASLITNLHNMENGLIAKDINNALKNRVNLSLKSVDSQGKMQGYLLAYEGIYDGKPVIYIADLASTRVNPMVGGKLILTFLELYKKHYSDKGNLVPILAQARESTSYPIIKKGLDSFSKKLSKKVSMEELETYTEGNDTMHKLLLNI
jgi:hypothetical protein